MASTTREGVLYGLAAYGWWGLVPIYFRWLGTISPLDILAHRIFWSAVFLAIILTVTKRWHETIRCLKTRDILRPLIVSAILVAFNWLMYILAVYLQKIVQASLGYFILPLVNIALGMLIFGERMRSLQYAAVIVAGVGVLSLALTAGEIPWLAIALAFSFSFYGMIRKKVPVDGLTGLAVETIVLLPIAMAGLIALAIQRGDVEDAQLLGKLSLSGVVTAIPLLCFGQAARRLPFSLLGFMQFISPSLQFLLAITLFSEEVRGGWWPYLLVWIALVIFCVDSYRMYRPQKAEA